MCVCVCVCTYIYIYIYIYIYTFQCILYNITKLLCIADISTSQSCLKKQKRNKLYLTKIT